MYAFGSRNDTYYVAESKTYFIASYHIYFNTKNTKIVIILYVYLPYKSVVPLSKKERYLIYFVV